MPLRKVITTRFFRSQPFSLPPPSVRWYYQYLKFVRAACMCVFYTYKLSSGPPRYRYLTLRYVRYRLDTGTRQFGKVRFGLDTGTRYFGKFGTPTQTYPGCQYAPHQNTRGAGISSVRPPSIPYRTLRYGSVRTHKRYPILRQARHNLNTGTRHFARFGTTSTWVPDASARSA